MSDFYEVKNAYRQNKPREEVLQLYKDFENKEELYNGDTLIHLAAYNADCEAIEILLNAGVKAAILNSYNKTPLHILADHETCYVKPSYQDIYKATLLLLDAKVSPLRKDDNGLTCYHVAATRGTYPMIQALIDRSVKLNMTDKEGHTTLHIACQNIRDALHSQKYAIEDFDKRSSQPQEQQETWERRRLESLQQSAEKLASANSKVEDYFKIVKALLDVGFDPDTKDNYGEDALGYAIKSKAKKIASLLKGEYGDDEAANELAIAAGGMSLHQAVAKNDMDAVNARIKMGADLNEVSGEGEFEGKTPLAVACSYAHLPCIEVLMAAGADPNFKAGEQGHTAMYYLVIGSDINAYTDGFFKDNHIKKILKSMLNAGLNINGFVDDSSNTALLLNCKRGCDKGYNYFTVKDTLANELVDLQCDVNLANLAGETPLMVLVADRFASENLVITLLENGAAADVCDKNGCTPLMYAAKNDRQNIGLSVIQLMMDFGDVKLDAVNNEGKTALDFATEANNEEIVKLLLASM